MIEQIDKEISEQLEKIRVIVKDLHFEEVCQFQVREVVNEIPWNDLKHQGLYLIEVKNDNKYTEFKDWLNEFRAKWEDPKYLKKFTPNFKKKELTLIQN